MKGDGDKVDRIGSPAYVKSFSKGETERENEGEQEILQKNG